jgi:hypothetical protein
MNRLSRSWLLMLLLLFFFMSVPDVIHAQIGSDCDYQDPDIPCPIDSGLYVLVALGVLYGIFKYWIQKNRLNSTAKLKENRYAQ